MINCNKEKGPWSHKFVDCANEGTDTDWAKNDKDGKEGHMGYGGLYKCPSGRIYAVGDNNDNCKSLNGKNGTEVRCFKKKGPWSGRKVDCSKEKPGGGAVTPSPPPTDVKPECKPETPETWQARDTYKKSGWAHWWGGEYKCPSGKVY